MSVNQNSLLVDLSFCVWSFLCHSFTLVVVFPNFFYKIYWLSLHFFCHLFVEIVYSLSICLCILFLIIVCHNTLSLLDILTFFYIQCHCIFFSFLLFLSHLSHIYCFSQKFTFVFYSFLHFLSSYLFVELRCFLSICFVHIVFHHIFSHKNTFVFLQLFQIY